MMIEEIYDSNLISFKELRPGDCFKSTEDDRMKTECVYYLKLGESVKQHGTIYNAIKLDNGIFWPFDPAEKVYKIKAKVVIEDLIK